MILPDVNLLVYAYNRLAPEHELAKEWWESAVSSEAIALSWVCIGGFIRIVTNRRAVQTPLTVSEALGAVRSWLEQPNVIVIEPGPQFKTLFFGLLEQIGTAGNLTTDAQLAALAIEHQCTLHSADLDFGRFSGLRWLNPLKRRK